jgi:hypothetical protein
MSLTQGKPLPNIKTTKDVVTTGPEWYEKYLEDLAGPGTKLLQKTGDELIAPMSDLQQGVLDRAEGELGGYTDTLDSAADTADLAAKGMTPEMIQSFLNPYTGNVTDEMARLQQQNLQRNLLPSLKGAFGSTGATGSQRMLGAMGQMGADVQANLLGQQQKAMSEGYSSALKAAAEQSGLYRSAADTQRQIGVSELDTKLKELERLYNLGGEEQKLEQAKIMAPLMTAKSAADVYSNIKVPSTVSETSNAPIPGAYGTSPLATISGLGSLFASGSGGTSAAAGILKTLFGKDFDKGGKGLYEWLKGESASEGPEELGGGGGEDEGGTDGVDEVIDTEDDSGGDLEESGDEVDEA